MGQITRTGKYLSVPEAAEHIGVRGERIRQVAKDGRFPLVRIGGFDIVHFDDAEAWRKQRAEKTHFTQKIVVTPDVSEEDGNADG